MEESDKSDMLLKDEDSSMRMENSMDEDSEDNQRESSEKSNVKGKKSKKQKDEDEIYQKKGKEINVQKHKIKIDCEAIHQLLGVPCGDVTIESITKLKIKDESVKAWRNRYPRNFMAPSELVSNIENVEDEDSFNFRLDFLLCFLAVMVECHGQGRCIQMDKNTNPIGFWNMNRLKDRQKWEIEHGGFGKGKYKGLSKVIVDEVEGNIGFSVVKQKKLFDSKFRSLLENHPE
ncbi:hypothetical protein L1987_87051 [Smallanthus sonchifolius]|nr:hypothetical protein L1987_87051 [Smallanthus sonchifolius]